MKYPTKKGNQVFYTKFNTDCFLTQKDMSALRHQIEVENSRAKRGLKPQYPCSLSTVTVYYEKGE